MAHADAGRGVALNERYRLFAEIASGGMATIFLGRMMGPGGFARTVAIKRLHPQFSHDAEFVTMFLDEARVASRVRHPNVVSVDDVVTVASELYLVMDYVHGVSLASLLAAARAAGERTPPAVAVAIACDVLHGLHAAHHATSDTGKRLELVHRDVSPHNVMVGADGVARTLDFGVARTADRLQRTRRGVIKGKIAYTAPEAFEGKPITQKSDVYAAGVVLWESLTGRALFRADGRASIMEQILMGDPDPPSKHASDVPAGLDDAVLLALAHDPAQRPASAKDLAASLEACVAPASRADVADWVKRVAATELDARAKLVAAVEARPFHPPDEVSPYADTQLDVRAQPIPPAARAARSVPPAASVKSGPPARRAPSARVAALVALPVVALAAVVALGPRGAARAPVASSAPADSRAADLEASPAPEAVETAATSTEPTAEPAPRAVSATRRPRPRPLPAAAKPEPKDDCRVPYTLDDKGNHVYKPSCWGRSP